MRKNRIKGSALALAVLAITMLSLLGFGLLTVSFGVGQQSTLIQNEAAARAAAEAGYEKAVFWMSKQADMLSSLSSTGNGASGTLTFNNSECEYKITLADFLGFSPVYEISSIGKSGLHQRTISVYLVQAIDGWAMGMCRVPSGAKSTSTVSYAAGEVIDMPIHINSYGDPKDSDIDISLSGDPLFKRSVSMGESRYSSGGWDKYKTIINFFDNGIYFNQPASRITDADTIQVKIDRFEESTDSKYIFKPNATGQVSNAQPAVQLEFFVDNGVGKVRITDNCSVRGFMQNKDYKTYDFRQKKPGEYERYYIYAYHVREPDADATGKRFVVNVEDTYVTQTIGDFETEPGGQIYVNGNVILGSGDEALVNQDIVKGKITVVATGNIWIADSIVLDGDHDAGGIPSENNQNALGLVAQGVIKVVDPGMADYSYVDDKPKTSPKHVYVPIGNRDWGQPLDSYKRHLPDPMILEAAVTVGGGGWGAENVRRSYYGGRKETSGNQDALVLRGTINEVNRGVVGLIGSDGYLKYYYLDERLMTGILPGNIMLRGKYVPLPAGWKDYRQMAKN